MTKVVSERVSSKGTSIRLVDDGNYFVGIFSIEEKHEYPDGCAWFLISERWTDKNVAMQEFQKL